MRRALILFLCLSVAALVGCETMKSSWRWTREQIDPDPEISIDTSEIGDENSERLAILFAPMDAHLEELERLMEVQGDYPDAKWLQLLFSRFPWVDGAMTVEASGRVMSRQPEVTMKTIELAPLLAEGDAWLDRRPRAHLHETELGPEVSIASPFLKERTWLGLTVVHFDPRSLISLCPRPEELIVFVPGKTIIGSGKDQEAAQALFALDWPGILENEVDGVSEAGGREFTWLARDFAGLKLIYAVIDVAGDN
jgi:hypothetical protein